MLRAVELNEGIEIGVKASLTYLGMNSFPQPFPFGDITGDSALLCGSNRAIDGYPSHHFGVNEMTLRSAHFPDAIIGVLPSGLKEIEKRLPNAISALFRRPEAGFAALK